MLTKTTRIIGIGMKSLVFISVICEHLQFHLIGSRRGSTTPCRTNNNIEKNQKTLEKKF